LAGVRRPAPPEPLELQLEAAPPSVTEARRLIAGYAAKAGADPADVELAVAEAVANSVIHAYPGRSTGTITLRANLGPDALVVYVTDDGTGMRPNPEAGGLGLGLALIGSLTAAFSVTEPADGGTSLRMSFPLMRGNSADG
jgi:anti-sigma regulatory factor (Ser/Thr protein kinase)